MKKIKLGLYTGLATATTALAFCTVISCSPNKTSRRDLRTVTKGENPFVSWYSWAQGAFTSTYGSGSASKYVLQDSARARFLRVETDKEFKKGKARFKPGTKIIEFGEDTHPTSLLKFELADSVKVITKEGKEYIFDKDDSPKNPQSINSPQFQGYFNDGISQLRFHVREGVTWADHKGNATKYKLNPLDFYYAYNRLTFNEKPWRKANGWDEKIETISASEGNREYPNNWSNEYLLQLFGYQLKKQKAKCKEDLDAVWSNYKIKKSDDVIEWDLKNQPWIKYYFDMNNEYSSFSGFKKLFATSTFFEAVSSEYIRSAEFQNTEFQHPLTKTKLTKKTGLLEDFGYYRYSQMMDKRLYAGAYVPIVNNLNRVKVAINKNYWDKKWLKNPETVKSFTSDYISASDDTIFQRSLFEQYKTNRIWSLKYGDAAPKVRLYLRKNWDKYGLRYGSIKQVAAYNSNMQLALIPFVPYDEKGKAGEFNKNNYLYNDAAAKVLYGKKLEEIFKTGSNNLVQNSALGSGRSFMSIINASINWYTITNIVASDGTKVPWTLATSAETKWGGKDQEDSSNKNKQVKNGYDYLMTQVAYNYDKKTGRITPEKISVTPKANKKQFDDSKTAEEQRRSPEFKKLQIWMKKLLDNLNIKKDDPIIFPIFNRSVGDASPKNELARQAMLKVIKSLDSRLQPKMFLNTKDTWRNLVNRGTSFQDYLGWSGDYNGIGTMISGLMMLDSGYGHSGGWPQIFATILKNESYWREIFPQLTDMAVSFRDDLYKKVFPTILKDNYKLMDWDKVIDLNSTKIRGIGFKELIAIKKEGEKELPEKWKTAPFTMLAKWCFEYQKSHSNKDLMALLKQTEGIVHPVWNTKQATDNRDRGFVLVEQSFITAPSDMETNNSFLRDWKIKKDK